ncbi:hypothetical protein VNO80_21029 [Phaseolus coccineus]|uniref:Uncharacterized protein n=1 Tax=Phaseolus coccineus TaxID=3886 RepID=A0AAN9M780_PHACN
MKEHQSNPWTALNEGHKQESGLPQLWRRLSICCSSKTGYQLRQVAVPENDDRPPFVISLAVILAGFAFRSLLNSTFRSVLEKIFGDSEAVCANSS